MRPGSIAILLILLATVASCASRSKVDARVPPEEQGVLMAWDSGEMPGGDETDREIIDLFITTWQRLPADVRVESRTDSRAVLTLDMGKAGMAMAARAREEDYRPIPVRMVAEIERDGGKRFLHTRRYYLGKDPEMLAEIERNLEHARETGSYPPTR